MFAIVQDIQSRSVRFGRGHCFDTNVFPTKRLLKKHISNKFCLQYNGLGNNACSIQELKWKQFYENDVFSSFKLPQVVFWFVHFSLEFSSCFLCSFVHLWKLITWRFIPPCTKCSNNIPPPESLKLLPTWVFPRLLLQIIKSICIYLCIEYILRGKLALITIPMMICIEIWLYTKPRTCWFGTCGICCFSDFAFCRILGSPCFLRTVSTTWKLNTCLAVWESEFTNSNLLNFTQEIEALLHKP